MATWEHHPNNEDSVNPLPPMTLTDVLPTNDTIQKLEEHCQWHIKAILVEKYFPQLRLKLGSPQSAFTLCHGMPRPPTLWCHSDAHCVSLRDHATPVTGLNSDQCLIDPDFVPMSWATTYLSFSPYATFA